MISAGCQCRRGRLKSAVLERAPLSGDFELAQLVRAIVAVVVALFGLPLINWQ